MSFKAWRLVIAVYENIFVLNASFQVSCSNGHKKGVNLSYVKTLSLRQLKETKHVVETTKFPDTLYVILCNIL